MAVASVWGNLSKDVWTGVGPMMAHLDNPSEMDGHLHLRKKNEPLGWQGKVRGRIQKTAPSWMLRRLAFRALHPEVAAALSFSSVMLYFSRHC